MESSIEIPKIISVILAILIFLILIIVGLLSKMLKETNEETSPYSFSRFQLFLWTCIITPLFILRWGWHSCNPDCGVMINETGLVLLGISSSTTFIASAVVFAQLKDNVKLKANGTTQGFWKDILSDDNGQFSVVRLQNFVFTLVYCIIYLLTFFINNKEYPSFNMNAYVLMGISSGSYILGKTFHK